MEILILEKEAQETFYPEAYALLEGADEEFVPPLSARSSSTQRDLSGSAKNTDGIRRYFEQLKNQRFAVVTEEGKLIGFVSYKENYTCPEIGEQELPNIYLSTLVVSPAARGKGVTRALYQHLFSAYAAGNIFTRTWSTNIAHIRILEGYGFETVCVLKDHRGPGLDTVYFKKPTTGLPKD